MDSLARVDLIGEKVNGRHFETQARGHDCRAGEERELACVRDQYLGKVRNPLWRCV